MIDSLMYLTASRPDLVFSICMCARYHFIKEQVKNGIVELYFVRTEYQLADIFTMELGQERLDFPINKLGMRSISPKTLNRLAEEVWHIFLYPIDPVDTRTMEKSKLDANPQGKEVDPTHYCGMIDSLMYLTASRPDLVFSVCMCARYLAKPTEHAVKRIFRYLSRTINMGLCYSKDSCMALTAFVYTDHAGYQDTR
nr:uncharacterized mitochondrial protein AtMg00810-like [Tanacetum cinerariifolium]